MSILSWLWKEVFSGPSARKNMEMGMETEQALEQVEDAEEATSMSEYALEAKEGELLEDLESEESAFSTLLSKGIIKKSDLPRLRAMAKDLRVIAQSVLSTEASVHALLEQDSKKLQQALAMIDGELKEVSETEHEALQVVDENLRQQMLSQAGTIHAALIQERFAYTSAKGVDSSLQKLEARARPLKSRMMDFVQQLASYIETGNRNASLKNVQLLQSLNKDLEIIEQTRQQYINQIIKRDDNCRKWRDKIKPAWATLRALYTESTKAA